MDLAEGLAGAAHARATRSGPKADVLEAAGTAFRYDRELISAADMNAWLEQSQLTVDDWSDYLTRRLLRRNLADTLDEVLDQHQPSAADLIRTAFAEGVCSGAFLAFENQFAGRAALAGDQLAGPLSPSDPASASEAAQLVHTNAHWLSMWPADDAVARARRVLAMDALYQSEAARLLADASLAAVVDRHRMEWRLIDTDTVVFTTEHAAREAILCITDEKLSVQHVASLARRTAVRQSRFADEIDAADRLLSADPGSLLGPDIVDGGFAVTHLVGLTWPSLDDPRVADWAQRAVVDAAVQLAVRERVTRRAGS